jgi:hypothetical protein
MGTMDVTCASLWVRTAIPKPKEVSKSYSPPDHPALSALLGEPLTQHFPGTQLIGITEYAGLLEGSLTSSSDGRPSSSVGIPILAAVPPLNATAARFGSVTTSTATSFVARSRIRLSKLPAQ